MVDPETGRIACTMNLFDPRNLKDFKDFVRLFPYSDNEWISEISIDKIYIKNYEDYLDCNYVIGPNTEILYRLNRKGKIYREFLQGGLEKAILTMIETSHLRIYGESPKYIGDYFSTVVTKENVDKVIKRMFHKGLLKKEYTSKAKSELHISYRITQAGYYILENGVIELERDV